MQYQVKYHSFPMPALVCLPWTAAPGRTATKRVRMMNLPKLLSRIVRIALCDFNVGMICPGDTTRDHAQSRHARRLQMEVLDSHLVLPLLLAWLRPAQMDGNVELGTDAVTGLGRGPSALAFRCVDRAVLVAVGCGE